MNEEKFNSLSKEEQMRLASDFRKTVHDGEIFFVDVENAKSLTPQEAKEQLLKQRNELLESLGFATSNDDFNEEIGNDYSRNNR